MEHDFGSSRISEGVESHGRYHHGEGIQGRLLEEVTFVYI